MSSDGAMEIHMYVYIYIYIYIKIWSYETLPRRNRLNNYLEIQIWTKLFLWTLGCSVLLPVLLPSGPRLPPPQLLAPQRQLSQLPPPPWPQLRTSRQLLPSLVPRVPDMSRLLLSPPTFRFHARLSHCPLPALLRHSWLRLHRLVPARWLM